ncbi:unnamed protein product, partial [Mesorhabditis spiculigera]
MGTDLYAVEPCCPDTPTSSTAVQSIDTFCGASASIVHSTSSRPFKIIVQKQTFYIDAENLSQLSPIFSIMCFGKDFDKMEEPGREIVDEKSSDVKTFLDAVEDHSLIKVRNVPVLLRLANKYQMPSIVDACEQFMRRLNLDALTATEVLQLLLAADEWHSAKDVVVRLIRRLANEEKTTFNKLKLSRRLPAQMYGCVIGTNLNLCQLKEAEQMNGHWLHCVGSRARWYRAPCDYCKLITECSNCTQCRKTMCRDHLKENKCRDSYGTRMLAELRENIVELDWE